MSKPSDDTVDIPPALEFADTFFARGETSFPIAFGGASHVGRVRQQNEDHFAIVRFRRAVELLLTSVAPSDLQIPDTCSYAMVVADGMGGMRSGEYASRLALQTMLELAGQATSWVMKLNDADAQQIQERVDAYVQRIHHTLQRRGESDPASKNMGTTWTSAHFLGEYVVIVHLGDSRAYLYRDEKLRQITRDETMAQSLIDSGMEPDSVSRLSHILINSLGGGKGDAHATVHYLEFDASDRLLLCTDGLSRMVSDEDIAEELRRNASPQATSDALIKRALANGGRDNVTVVLASAGSASSVTGQVSQP